MNRYLHIDVACKFTENMYQVGTFYYCLLVKCEFLFSRNRIIFSVVQNIKYILILNYLNSIF